MNLIKFNDNCTISRETGEVDEWGDPVVGTVYEGPCLYQEGGAGFTWSMVTRTSPCVYLPSRSVQVDVNDSVAITTAFGRVFASVSKVVRDIRLKHFGLDVTKIELKQTAEE